VNKEIYLCVDGKSKTGPNDFVSVNGIRCRDTCPLPNMSCTRETFVRKWSDAATWTSGNYRKLPTETTWSSGVPSAGDDVMIPCPWTMYIDVTSINVHSITIDGMLRFDSTIPNVASTTFSLIANYIWVRGGQLLAGDQGTPFPGQINIQLTG
jgi:hypothetical protein